MEVDEWVAVPADGAPGTRPGASESSVQSPTAPLPLGAPVATTPEKARSTRLERVTIIHAHCLCPQHNPVYLETKKREARDAMIQQLAKAPYASPVSLKSPESRLGYLLSYNSDDETVLVSDGQG